MLKMKLIQSFVILLLLTESTLAQQGTIHGKVRTPSGATLNGVIVELWQTGSHVGQTVTNTEGDFYFTGLVPANYELVISQQGYQRVSERAVFRMPGNMNQREVVEVEIRLVPMEKEISTAPPGTTFVQTVPFAAKVAFEQGMARIKDNKVIEGIALLQEAVQAYPDYFNAHVALGAEYIKQNRLDEAIKALERARQINDRDARVWHLFGVVMAQQQKYNVAEFAFRQAVERDPVNAQSRFSHGLTLLELAVRTPDQMTESRLIEAERELRKALELSQQKQVAAYLHLGRIAELRGERKQAAEWLETYLKQQPADPNAASIREAIIKLKAAQ